MEVVLILLILAAGIFALLAFNFERNKAIGNQKINAFIEQKKKNIAEIKKQGEIRRGQRA